MGRARGPVDLNMSLIGTFSIAGMSSTIEAWGHRSGFSLISIREAGADSGRIYLPIVGPNVPPEKQFTELARLLSIHSTSFCSHGVPDGIYCESCRRDYREAEAEAARADAVREAQDFPSASDVLGIEGGGR